MMQSIRFSNNYPKWLLPLGALIALAGYFGPWINHSVAGLVVTGLDLGEFVKFLVPVRNGEIAVWREGFYLPLFTVSLALSLFAFRQEMGYGWPMRILLLLVAGVAALNMLPPAWDPPRLQTPEFRLQTIAIALSLLSIIISPFWALLPRWSPSALIAILSVGSLWFPIWSFLQILPTVRWLYKNPLSLGWGMYLMALGIIILLLSLFVMTQWQATESTIESVTESVENA